MRRGAYLIRMTLTTRSSNSMERVAFGTDIHLKAGFRGNVRMNRKLFAERGIPYFQHFVYDRTGVWIPRFKIRVRYEREQPTSRATKTASVIGQTMAFRGRHVAATSPIRSRMILRGKMREKHAKSNKRSKKARRSK
jgi:hypothetical protein